MTTPNDFGDFGDPNTHWDEPGEREFFNAEEAQGHLLILRIQDVAQYVRNENFPDGMVYPKPGAKNQFDPFPNSAVRASIVDLNLYGEDGALGKVYPEAMIFPSSLTKPLKGQVGKMRLAMWNKIASNPKLGPQRNDPYGITNMAGNDQAVAAAQEFLARHPEFLAIPAPEPYDGKPPQPQAPQYPPQQGGWGPQPGYGQQQPYPPAQPGYGYPQQPPAQPSQWQPQGPPQQYPPQAPPNYGPPQQPPQWAPQQPPAAPPQYNQPPQQARQGSFLQQAAQQPYYPQHEPNQPQQPNHQGGWQPTEAPF